MTWFNQSGFDELDLPAGFGKFMLNSAGSVACKTDFVTGVRILDSNGKDITVQAQKGVPVWMDVPEGSVLEWRVQTLADSKEGASDRVNIDITAMDPTYMMGITSLVVQNATDDELMQILNGDNAPMKKYLEANPNVVDPSLAQATFYSQTITTGEDGKATGTIPIDPSWGKSLFSINFHYGYSSLAEMSTEDKTERAWKEEIGPLLIEALSFAALTAISGGAMLGVRLAVAAKAGTTVKRIKTVAMIAFAVEMAQMAKAFFAKGFGIIGINKYDCSFPYDGFNHIYSFNTDYIVSLENEAGAVDLSNIDENKLEALIQQDLIRNLAVGAIATGLLIWILTR